VDKCSVEDFRQYFEAPNIPVVVDGIVDKWSAPEEWTFSNLFEKYRHRRFKCGEDDDGNQVKIKLKYFLRYMDSQQGKPPAPFVSSPILGCMHLQMTHHCTYLTPTFRMMKKPKK